MKVRSRKRWRELVADPVQHEAFSAKRNERLRRKRRTRRVEKEKEKTCDDCELYFLSKGFPRDRGCPNTNSISRIRLVSGL